MVSAAIQNSVINKLESIHTFWVKIELMCQWVGHLNYQTSNMLHNSLDFQQVVVGSLFTKIVNDDNPSKLIQINCNFPFISFIHFYYYMKYQKCWCSSS